MTADYGHYPDSGVNFNAKRKSFKDSQEAAFRRVVRDCIKGGPLTKSERDVTLALVNIWFHHRNGPKGFIHPSREQIAKKTGVTVKTVSRTMGLLRDLEVLKPVSGIKGGQGKSTQYKVDVWTLCAFCGADWLPAFTQNVPVTDGGMSRYVRDKMSHCLTDVEPTPAKVLRVVGGRDA